jgi:hypothetical protein
LSVRPGEKGEVIAEYLTRRVFVWDGKAPTARCWYLLVRKETEGNKRKILFLQCQAAGVITPTGPYAG